MSNSLSTSLVFLSKDKNIPVTSTELIAKYLKRDHHSILVLARNHKADLERFGSLEFEIQVGRKDNNSGAKKEIILLNESQATLLITFMRNFPKVVEFKVALVDEFFRMKEVLNKQPKDSITLTKQDYLLMKEQLHDELYQKAYDEGWNDRNSTASLNWQEFNDLITVCQYNLDLKTQCLELMRDTKNIMNKLTEIKDNMNMLATGYIGTQSRVLDKLKSVKTAWLQRTQK